MAPWTISRPREVTSYSSAWHIIARGGKGRSEIVRDTQYVSPKVLGFRGAATTCQIALHAPSYMKEDQATYSVCVAIMPEESGATSPFHFKPGGSLM